MVAGITIAKPREFETQSRSLRTWEPRNARRQIWERSLAVMERNERRQIWWRSPAEKVATVVAMAVQREKREEKRNWETETSWEAEIH